MSTPKYPTKLNFITASFRAKVNQKTDEKLVKLERLKAPRLYLFHVVAGNVIAEKLIRQGAKVGDGIKTEQNPQPNGDHP